MRKTRVLSIIMGITMAFSNFTISYAAEKTTVRYEAEYASDTSSSVIFDRYVGYSGTGYQDLYEKDGYIQWNDIKTDEKSDARITIRYTYVGENPAQVSVSVNGGNPEICSLPATKSWYTWGEYSIDTELNEGVNSIKISNGVQNGPNIDYIDVDCVAKKNVNAANAEKLFKKLSALGILSGNTEDISWDEPMCRSDILLPAARMIGYTEQFGSTSQYFTDIAADDERCGAAEMLVQLGIISGYADGRYGMDDNITYESLAKIFVTILGYTPYANNAGGYPKGYVNEALRLGIFDGVEIGDDKNVTYSDFCTILDNVTDVDVFAQVDSGTMNGLEIKRGKGVLSYYMGIEKAKGVINSNEYTALSDEKSAMDGTVIIGEDIYQIGDTAATDYLGFNIEYYYKDDKSDDSRTLLYIEDVSKKNTELKINADCIEDADRTKIKYFLDGYAKTKQVKIAVDADFIYNNSAYPEMTKKDLMPQSGFVRLIDNDNNGEYDVVFVESYSNIVVESASDEKEIIYSKFSDNHIRLNDTDYRIYNNGKIVELSEIKEGSSVSIAWNKTNEYAHIYISEKQVKGKIDSIEEDAVVIQGKRYEFAADFPSSQKSLITVGASLAFYINIEDKISAVSFMRNTDIEYGYMFKAESDSDFFDDIKLSVFTSGGAIKSFIIKDKLILNGTKIKAEDVLKSSDINGNSDTLRVEPQLIKYKVNDENRIIQLWTAKEEEGGDNQQLTIGSKLGKRRFKSVNNTFLTCSDDYGTPDADIRFFCGDDTVIFSIPANKNEYTDYAIGASVPLVNDASYYVETYDEIDSIPAVVLYYPEGITESDKISTNVTGTQDFFFVNKVGKAVIGDDIGLCVKGFRSGSEVEMMIRNADAVEGIMPGSVIIYNAANNKITALDVLYSPENSTFGKSASINYPNCMIYGTITKIADNGVLYVAYGSSKDDHITENSHPLILSNANVYLFDKNKNRVYKGDLSDIHSGAEVVLETSYTLLKSIMIID